MNTLTGLFSALLAMGLTALPVMAAVLLARLALGRVSRRFCYALWAVVGFRLVCPVTVGQTASLFSLPVLEPLSDAVTRPIPGTAFSTVAPAWTAPAPSAAIGTGGPAASAAQAGLSAGEWGLRIAAVVWLLGLLALAAWWLVSALGLRRQVAAAVRRAGNVWECDGLPTPFVLGLVRPRIYLPFRLSDEARAYVLAHEETHIRRGDPWAKAALCVLTVYWWHPGVWLCWTLFCRDMEMRCDEAALARLGEDARGGYCRALAGFALARRTPVAVAFGEHDALRRVKYALSWKQAGPWAVLTALLAVPALVLVCGTNPGNQSWVKVEGAGNDVTLTCALKAPIRSWALYEDVYEEGTLRSSTPRIVRENVGNTRVSGTLRTEVTYGGDGGLGERLNCTYEDVSWTTQLPKSHYTGAGGVLGNADTLPPTLRQTLESDGEAAVLTWMFSTEPNGGVTTYDREDGVTAHNDTVVRFRLVTSTENLAHDLLALAAEETADSLAATLLLDGPWAVGTADAVKWHFANAGKIFFITAQQPKKAADRLYRSAAVLLALRPEVETVVCDWPAKQGGVGTRVSFTREDVPFDWEQTPTPVAVQRLLDDLEASVLSSEGTLEEPFTDILGYSGVRETEAWLSGWSIRTYYAEEDETRRPIADSFGWGEPEDFSVDLDGDGIKELICNVTFGADGAQRAYVYQRRGEEIWLGTPSPEDLPGFVNWGANAYWSEYDPVRNVFSLHYCVDMNEDYALKESQGLEGIAFSRMNPDESV